jgi:alginate O-acetyltransferase complex protein AlgI
MLFNSFPFIIFIIIVFGLFYFPFKENSKWQNWLLLISSYFFYGYADVKMIPLLLLTTTLFYFLARLIHKNSEVKIGGILTTIGVIVGIGVLFYYKYFDFFFHSLNQLFLTLNITQANWRGFNVIMPLGISFFTFKLISYIVEVNRGKIEPINDFVAFAAYISFFPTILSGPIDRPNTFLPQLKKYHNFDYNMAVDGCRQILWGAFQKLVIADNLATYTSYAWNNIETSRGSTLAFAAILYTLQIYTDFSGYSDMAIGIGKLLGFKVTKNFNYPFFATNVAEYWRRWHISLTSWLTDYIFMPLNIKWRNWGNWGTILSIMITFVLIGLWHGANWTFAVFGVYYGLLYIPLILSGSFMKKKKLRETKYGLPAFPDLIKMVGTFLLVTIGLVIFNAKNIGQAFQFIGGIVSPTLFEIPSAYGFKKILIIIVFVFIFLEWKNRTDEYAFEKLGLKWGKPLRLLMYYIIIILIILLSGREQQFIYFQF